MAPTALPESFPLSTSHQPRLTQITSVETMVVELATEVCCRDSNQVAKWAARNRPLRMLSRSSFLPIVKSSCRTDAFPKTAGVMSTTVHSSRQAAVTPEGAVEYFTKIEERETPRTPSTIMIHGRFSRQSIVSP